MNKSEIQETLERYFSKESNTVKYKGTGELVKKLVDMSSKGVTHFGDAPDMYITYNNEVWIIEHFQFDAYLSSKRKGSMLMREEDRIRRKEKELEPSETGTIFHEQINGTSSYQMYIENVCTSFCKHASKINTYKQNLIAQNIIHQDSVVKVLFLIEDVSPIGAMAIDNKRKVVPIELGACREFLEIMKLYKGVDAVIACSEVSQTKFVWFISNDEIDTYIEQSSEYKLMQFMDFTPHVIGMKVVIPDK